MGSVPSAGSIKLPSPAPVAVAASAQNTTGSAGQRSRLSQQVHSRQSPSARGGRRVTASVGPDADEDAEGEEDLEEENGEDNGDAEDTQIYCFCQKMSYGEVSRVQFVALSRRGATVRSRGRPRCGMPRGYESPQGGSAFCRGFPLALSSCALSRSFPNSTGASMQLITSVFIPSFPISYILTPLIMDFSSPISHLISTFNVAV